MRENCRVFEAVTFRPRHAVATGDCDLRTRVVGSELSFPATTLSWRVARFGFRSCHSMFPLAAGNSRRNWGMSRWCELPKSVFGWSHRSENPHPGYRSSTLAHDFFAEANDFTHQNLEIFASAAIIDVGDANRESTGYQGR